MLWEVENGPSPLLWPVAYTTTCTIVQAVTEHLKLYPKVPPLSACIGAQVGLSDYIKYKVHCVCCCFFCLEL